MQKIVIFLSIVVLLALAAMGAYIWQNEQDKQALMQQISIQLSPAPSPAAVSPTPAVISSPSGTTNNQQASEDETTGTITGSLSYPSEAIPDMKVCAQNTATNQEVCTQERIAATKFQYGVGYELKVPAGTYLVYAQLLQDPYKAYYNEFVTCGLSVNCTSEDPIEVTVKAGTVVEKIDPIDWYHQGQ